MAGNPPHLYEERPFRIVTAIRDLFEGRSNAVGTVTLTASTTTTTVTNLTSGADSKIFLFPTTANGSAELAAGGCYISATAQGSFTITHANNAQTDRTFFWCALG